MQKTVLFKTKCLLALAAFVYSAGSNTISSTSTFNASVSMERAETTQQAKRINGVIVDSEGQPLVGASVNIVGTQTAVVTDIEGKFSLMVAEKDKLRITFVGFTATTVDVGKQTQLRITLNEDRFLLGEIEVTAEFGMKRVARGIGSSVQNVKATDITESGRDNFISALQGRVSGLNVISSGGAPGASTTVVLRSITSISGNNQPLYVVDGIPINNSTIDAFAAFADASGALDPRNIDFSSRGNDFNPEDIESMTILKGAAAAALYGSNASNGAIIITTKKGGTGKGQVTYSNSFRWDKAYGYPDMQTKYAEGAYGTTNYYYTSRYGGLYPEGTKFYDNIGAVLQTGFTKKHNISVETGSEKVSLRASASFLDQTGVIKTTDYSRTNFSLAGKAEVNRWLNIEVMAQYSTTGNRKTLRGTDGPLYMAMRWPIIDDMSTYLDVDGSHMRRPDKYTDTDLLNPLFGLNRNKYYDESERIITTAAVNITPTKNTFVRAQWGVDATVETAETSRHPYFSNNNAGSGSYNLSKANLSDPTMNILAGYHDEFFKKKLSFSVQVGYHQQENAVSRISTYGTKFAVPDFQSINNCDVQSIVSSKTTTKRRVQAISSQMEVSYANMAFLTLRARNDWSSTLPKNNRSYFYPAAEGAFILTELPMLKENASVSYLKLRGAVAQVGKDAGPLEIDPQLIPTDLTGGGYKYYYTGPNKKLRPEMTTSWEIGAEGRFFNDRIVADFTYFRTHCADQIVKGFRLSYATGFILNNMNVGTFNTWGWEAHIDGDIIRQGQFRWNVGLNLYKTDSKVVYLPENVSEYYNAYTWNSGNLRNGIRRGYPVSTLTGLPYQRNNAGEILISPTTGLPLVSDVWDVLGDREPKLRFGITTSVTYKNLRLSAMFAGRYKTTVINGTKRTMMVNGTSWESVRLREQSPLVFNGVLKDGNENTNPTKSNIAVDYKIYGTSIFTGYDEDWVENNVNYLRLQEIRLNYNVPSKQLKKVFNGFISKANIFLTGNDLFTWTNYSGIDAVGNTMSASGGGTGGEGYDLWSIPNPRGMSFGLSVTF